MEAAVAIVALPETIIALVAAILIMAIGFLFKYILRALAKYIPIIGHDIEKYAQKIIDYAYHEGVKWWDASLAPLVAILATPVVFFQSWFNLAGDIFEKLGQQILDMPHTVAVALGIVGLKSALTTMESDVQAIRSAAQAIEAAPAATAAEVTHLASHLIGQAVAGVETDIHAAVNEAESIALKAAQDAAAIGSAAQLAVNQLAVQVGTLAQGVQNLAHQIGNLTPGAVAHDVQTALDSAEAFTKSAEDALSGTLATALGAEAAQAAQLVGNLSATLTTAVSGIDQVIQASRSQLTAEIAAAEGAATTYADKIFNQLRGEVGTIAADLATAGAAAAATAATVTDYLDNCGTPLCENVKPRLPWMQDLESMFQDGLLMALLAECIRDPEGAAAALHEIIQPVVDGASAVVHEMMQLQ